MKYNKTQLDNNIWVITESGHDYKNPIKKASYTFAFDTETLVLLDGKKVTNHELYIKLKNVSTKEKRKRVTSITWAYQCYDEYNGFFMTNDFLTCLTYCANCGYKYGWCYNATFDFSQIDYQVLAVGKDLWKPHKRKETIYEKDIDGNIAEVIERKTEIAEYNDKVRYYNKHQPYTYESLHNETGVRYAYKLWVPYYNKKSYRENVHAVELRDFMKLCGGGLKRVLNDLDIRDNENKPIRKLTMEYQAVDPNNLSEEEIDYCNNDVKGLYFAVKKFNETIEKQSNGESHVYGKETNIMTSGGFAKRELLRSLYPYVNKPSARIKFFQHDHKINVEQDRYVRNACLYRGGITYLNPHYKGKLVKDKVLYRYDVNSEYPYAMTLINDLVGYPFLIKINKWLKYPKKKKEQYECIYICKSISGKVKKNMLGVWYNPFTKDFEDNVYEEQVHLIFERELEEMYKWYDLEIDVEEVILIKRGKKAYKKFIDENYKIKAEAKRNKNKTLEQVTKLKLNSSYGKLAERVERVKGHYELNEETGAIHFVEDGEEIDGKSILSVFIGALITCVARIYILTMARTICKNVSKEWVYCDTDSLHTTTLYEKADAFTLGALKNETPNGVKVWKYIAPKTYVDVLEVQKDGSIKIDDIELHSKGISLLAIMTELRNKKKITIKDIDEAVAYGKKYTILCAMNVKGGKVLLPTDKYIATKDQAPKNKDNETCFDNVSGLYLYER